ncbi:MAG: squalene/phytoene synthase family protein [Verrucomicrobiota bacterium]|nr:squalene/phytoene synthase family protein [Verrucomicrobiota bacterium]
MKPPPQYFLLNDLLRATSRSFYLTMRILPLAIRPQISLAYLLARATDTIADTEIIPVENRLKNLAQFRDRILGTTDVPLDFGELANHQSLPAEKILLERCEDALKILSQFSEADQKEIRNVLKIIISGQELDLQRFARLGQTPSSVDSLPQIKTNLGSTESRPTELKIIALADDSELDDYTYRVAGCVGEFWTKMCRAHLFPKENLDDKFLIANGIRFGKGLQFVNILRDLPKDLRQGRCYIPQENLHAIGLQPIGLLSPLNGKCFHPLFQKYLDQAESHLAAGWEYTNALPAIQVRLRLACAWPILIGIKTLRKLRDGNILDPAQRIKISRAEVRQIVIRSILSHPRRSAWERQFQKIVDGKES